MTTFTERFNDYYTDPFFLPRNRTRALLDILPAILFAIRGR